MEETIKYYRDRLFELEKEYNNLSPADVRGHFHLPDQIELFKEFIETLESYDIIHENEVKTANEENARLREAINAVHEMEWSNVGYNKIELLTPTNNDKTE